MKTLTTILAIAFLATVTIPASASDKPKSLTVSGSPGGTVSKNTKKTAPGDPKKPIADQAATGVLSKKKN